MNTNKADQRGTMRMFGPVKFTMFVKSDRMPASKQKGEFHTALDISEGGLRFYAEHQLPENTLVEFHLQPQGLKQPITQFGRVKWQQHVPSRKGYDMGVQFVESAGRDGNAWLDYIHGRLERMHAAEESLLHVA